MTLPEDRTRALIEVGELLHMLQPYAHGKTERVLVPSAIIVALDEFLLHYPGRYELHRAHVLAPSLFGPTESDEWGAGCTESE